MKNFLKENWFKYATFFIMFVTIFLFLYFFKTYINEQRQLEGQKDCADRAIKVLANYNEKAWDTRNEQINHFNLKMNKCFVMISSFSQLNSPKTFRGSNTLIDAYENKDIVICQQNDSHKFCFYENGKSEDFDEKKYNDYLKRYLD